uniref:C-type lectin domain-containing protein n=1 Tax=Terrapene triunguis TaxID=2587831 RepID=A0A674JSK9_9SAUR
MGCLTLKVHQISQDTEIKNISINVSQRSSISKLSLISVLPSQKYLFSFQGQKCSLCPENWFWYGEVCYHLSTEWKTWQGSKDYCSSHDSRLLKIENKEELVMSFPSSLTVDTKPGMNAAMGVGFILHVHIATDKMTPPMHCILGHYQGKLGSQCIKLEKVIKEI